MSEQGHVLAIDQGTTSTRAIVFDARAQPLAAVQRTFPQHYPADGWVEHDAEDIWRDTVAVCREVIAKAGLEAGDIAAIGITNQRETTLIWDRETGTPIHNAIVWQDRRTAPLCRRWREAGHEEAVRRKTGLVIDAYFVASKINWLLENVEGARARAEAGKLAVGTIDSFLLWRLTGGRVHASDISNACRTMIFDIGAQTWDDELLTAFAVPRSLLPEVMANDAYFGDTDPALFGRAIPIRGMAGDQQAAVIGQACFHPGMIKSTYGTGCFALLHTGETMVPSPNRLLTTVAYRIGGRTCYAIEGSIFNAGTAVQWVRDEIQMVATAAETEHLALSVEDAHGVYLIPAFTGLGAPYWDPDARGAITGLTRDAHRAHIVRAVLESTGYQTRDLLDAMAQDLRASAEQRVVMPQALRVDGGMVANNFVCQFLADILGLPVQRPTITETTALGAAYLAGIGAGLYGGLDEIEALWQREREFTPQMAAKERRTLYDGWLNAVQRVKTTPA